MPATSEVRRLLAALAVGGALLAGGCSDDEGSEVIEEPNLGEVEAEGEELEEGVEAED